MSMHAADSKADVESIAYLLKRAMPASLLCLRSFAAPNLAISAAPAVDAVLLRLLSLPPLLFTAVSVSSAGRGAASGASCKYRQSL